MTGFERIQADLARRRVERDAAIRAAGGGRLVALSRSVLGGTQGAVVHRNANRDALPWRATWLDTRGEPSGHVEAPSLAGAMEHALGAGYQVAEVRA